MSQICSTEKTSLELLLVSVPEERSDVKDWTYKLQYTRLANKFSAHGRQCDEFSVLRQIVCN